MENYVQKVLRTESLIPKVDCNPRLLHALLGICTEIGEIVELNLTKCDNDKLLLEVGDCFWYVGVLFDVQSLDFDNILKKMNSKIQEFKDGTLLLPNKFITDKLVVISSKLLDYSKKNIFYGKSIPNLNNDIEDLLKWLLILCNNNNFDIDLVLEKNIDKLIKRFPEKFVAELAINKNEDEERKVLRV